MPTKEGPLLPYQHRTGWPQWMHYHDGQSICLVIFNFGNTATFEHSMAVKTVIRSSFMLKFATSACLHPL